MDMFRRAGVCLATALTVALLPGAVYADATTSPGTNSVHASTIGVALPPYLTVVVLTPLVTGTIAKGKPHRVLVVDGTISSIGAGDNACAKPQVNGIDFEPTDDVGDGLGTCVNCPSTATVGCSATGTWWVDLDAAETAHPGMFYGQPLQIVFTGFTNSNTGGSAAAVMNARLEKK
jgi:hypothetical protein